MRMDNSIFGSARPRPEEPAGEAHPDESDQTDLLRQDGENYRALFHSIRDAIVVSDTHRRIVHCNPAFTEMFGYTPEEVRGRTSRFLYESDQDFEAIGKAIHENLQKENFFHAINYVKKNNEVFPAETNICYFRDSSGKVNGLIGLIRDVTERKRADLALKKSEAMFRNLFEQAPVGIFRTNSAGRTLRLNPEMARIMGFDSPGEAAGFYKDLENQFYVDPERRKTFLKQISEAGWVENFEFEARRKDDQRIWLNMNARIGRQLPNRGGFIIEGFITDTTERRQARKRIEHLNRVLRAIGDINQYITREKDSDVLIRQICALLVKSRGYSGAMIVLNDGETRKFAEAGETFRTMGTALRKGQLPPCYYAALQQSGVLLVSGHSEACVTCSLAHDRRGDDVLCIRLQKGETVFGFMAVSVSEGLGSDNEEQTLFSEVADDVVFALYTIEMEKQALEAGKARDDALERLVQAQKMEAVGRLAGGIAHDFNNMLNVILGYSSLSLSRLDEGSPIHNYLLEIEQAAQHSAELTRQLLTFSRKQIVEPQIIDLDETVRNQENLLKRLIGEQIEIRFRPGGEIWSIRIDPNQIDQILTNLAVNSRDAMVEQGGLITIETENVTLGDHQIPDSQVAPGDYVRLSFSDTGTGMDTKTLERIFEPFFTTKENGKGTGLGLSTVYGIVEQNKGFILADSAIGVGTTIRIFIPRLLDAGEELASRAEILSLEGAETVLIVEDEKQVLDLAEMILKNFGYHVLKARSTAEALAIANRHGAIDLLLTDVIMPGMNGRELHAAIAALQPKIRTIFMSGYTDDVITSRGIVETDANFLQKPFTVERLAGKVRKVLDA